VYVSVPGPYPYLASCMALYLDCSALVLLKHLIYFGLSEVLGRLCDQVYQHAVDTPHPAAHLT
jgi:hypothetical protein